MAALPAHAGRGEVLAFRRLWRLLGGLGVVALALHLAAGLGSGLLGGSSGPGSADTSLLGLLGPLQLAAAAIVLAAMARHADVPAASPAACGMALLAVADLVALPGRLDPALAAVLAGLLEPSPVPAGLGKLLGGAFLALAAGLLIAPLALSPGPGCRRLGGLLLTVLLVLALGNGVFAAAEAGLRDAGALPALLDTAEEAIEAAAAGLALAGVLESAIATSGRMSQSETSMLRCSPSAMAGRRPFAGAATFPGMKVSY